MGTPSEAGSGGCFIAVAAYGSAFDSRFALLRKFRDHFPLTNSVGNTFVEFYYRHSAASADFIVKGSNLRAIVRLGLFPIVCMSWVFFKPGLIPIVVLIFLFGYCLIVMIGGKKNIDVNQQIFNIQGRSEMAPLVIWVSIYGFLNFFTNTEHNGYVPKLARVSKFWTLSESI